MVTYGALIHGYCKTGNLEEPMKIFKSMDGNAVPPNTVIYSILIDALCKEKDVDVANAPCG